MPGPNWHWKLNFYLLTNSWGACCNYQNEDNKHDLKITTRIKKRICRIVECHLFTFSDMLNKMGKKVNTCVQILLTYFLHCDVYIVLISKHCPLCVHIWQKYKQIMFFERPCMYCYSSAASIFHIFHRHCSYILWMFRGHTLITLACFWLFLTN